MIVHTELSAESRNAVHVGLADGDKESERRVVPIAERGGPAPGRGDMAQATDKKPASKIAQVIGLLMGTAEFQRR